MNSQTFFRQWSHVGLYICCPHSLLDSPQDGNQVKKCAAGLLLEYNDLSLVLHRKSLHTQTDTVTIDAKFSNLEKCMNYSWKVEFLQSTNKLVLVVANLEIGTECMTDYLQ